MTETELFAKPLEMEGTKKFRNNLTIHENVPRELIKNSHLQNQPELPLLSVCIPAYNSEVTLGKGYEPIVNQTVPAFAIGKAIVVREGKV